MKRTLAPSRTALRLGLAVLVALLLPGCNRSLGTLDFSGPFDAQWSTLRVSVQNSGPSEILVSYRESAGQSVGGGKTVHVVTYLSTVAPPGSDWFDVQRQAVLTPTRVTFQALRYPEKKGDVKDTAIVIGEPSPGRFTATAAEPEWVRVLSVTPMLDGNLYPRTSFQ